ncbi:hypothetical protein SDC9_184787 [bioreactor metagenome]|uniref:Uncharacterized protein n=1 Tax=bioreactor metagenome TaxID=1076179 RepID=A0A645HE33_9ZZZZ
MAPACRGRGGLRFLGFCAACRPVRSDGQGRCHRIHGKPEFHGAIVRLRDYGHCGQSADPGVLRCGGAWHGGDAANGARGGDLLPVPDADSVARVLHYRTCSDDPGRTHAARPVLFAKHQLAVQICDAWRLVRECLDRRHADQFRCAPGFDGGRHLGLGYALHVHDFRLEGRAGRPVECFAVDRRIPS